MTDRTLVLFPSSTYRLHQLVRPRRQRRLERYWPLRRDLLRLVKRYGYPVQLAHSHLDVGFRWCYDCCRSRDIRLQHYGRHRKSSYHALSLAWFLDGIRCGHHSPPRQSIRYSRVHYDVYLWFYCWSWYYLVRIQGFELQGIRVDFGEYFSCLPYREGIN